MSSRREDRDSPGGAPGPGTTISVVIPTYDRAGMVADAIDSVLAQTWPHREVIVVDDGSTDDTPRVLAGYGDRIRAVRQPNAGLAAARNRGIRESRGELVAFLDSDDMLEPGFMEQVVATFRRHPRAGAVFVAERTFVHPGDQPGTLYSKRTPGEWFTTLGLITRDTGVGSGRPPVVRREWLQRLGGFSEEIRCAVDCEMWIRYSFHVPMVLLPEPCVRRREHPGCISRNQAQDARDWLRILEDVRVRHPGFVAEHGRAFRHVLAKQHVRLGRELLVLAAHDRLQRHAARRHLWQAVRLRPLARRAWTYLLWSLVAPASYASWRRIELGEGRGPAPG